MNDDLAYRFLATLRENAGTMEYVDLMNAIGGDPNVAYDQLAILKSRHAVKGFLSVNCNVKLTPQGQDLLDQLTLQHECQKPKKTDANRNRKHSGSRLLERLNDLGIWSIVALVASFFSC